MVRTIDGGGFTGTPGEPPGGSSWLSTSLAPSWEERSAATLMGRFYRLVRLVGRVLGWPAASRMSWRRSGVSGRGSAWLESSGRS